MHGNVSSPCTCITCFEGKDLSANLISKNIFCDNTKRSTVLSFPVYNLLYT